MNENRLTEWIMQLNMSQIDPEMVQLLTGQIWDAEGMPRRDGAEPMETLEVDDFLKDLE